MSRSDWTALLISLAAFAAAVFVSTRVFENMPHIEDEIAFVWQARVIERGQLTVPTPPVDRGSFLVAFVVDYQGQRFGKYPIGWPVLLALGEKLHARHLVNPLLTGLAVWWIYRIVKKLVDEPTALLAILLSLTSPFLWMNSGTLLSHPWTLLLTLVFCAGWLDAFTGQNLALPGRISRVIPAVTAGLALGVLALTRPWTAVGVVIPFAIHGVYLLVRGGRAVRLRLALTGLLAGGVSALLFAWQFAVTGSPWMNPYTLWWPYDLVGFGAGHGLAPGGHDLAQAWANTQFSLFVANTDLLGWPVISWLFMPFGLLALCRSRRAWLVSLMLVSLVAAYSLYWTPSWVYGPRYYYEALLVPLLLTAAGMRWLAGFPLGGSQTGKPRYHRARFALTSAAAGLLVSANLLYYLPMRVGGLYGVAYISADCMRPFQTEPARRAAPALVFVDWQEHWAEYGCLQDLNSPFLDGDFVFAISVDPQSDAQVARLFPGRTILHYDPLQASLKPAQVEIRAP